jgi:signal transduction histidine kinase
MKIRNRLTLLFMVIVSVILIIVLSSVYYFAKENRKTIFYELLRQRTTAVANYFLEKDEVNSVVFSNFQREYAKTLPGEIVQLFDSTNHANFVPLSNAMHYSPDLLDEIRLEQEHKIHDGDRRAYGIYYLDNQGNFVIIVSAIDVQGNKELANLRLLMIFGFAASLLLTFLAGILFSKNALSSIQEIVNRVNTISSSSLHLRVNEGKGRDEIAQLAITFNNMLNRLETSFNMQQAFVNNASHELRTPLTSIIGEIDVLLTRARTDEEYKAVLQSIQSEANQMKEMVNGLLNLVRAGDTGDKYIMEDVRLDELLNDIKSAKLREYPKAIINLSVTDLPDDPAQLEVTANRQMLYIGISNIIDNAIKFSDMQPVNCILQFEKGKPVLKISDSGIGISSADSEKIFQTFYRSSNAQSFRGHGIGLSLSEKILRFFGATLTVQSELGKGSMFTIIFSSKK